MVSSGSLALLSQLDSCETASNQIDGFVSNIPLQHVETVTMKDNVRLTAFTVWAIVVKTGDWLLGPSVIVGSVSYITFFGRRHRGVSGCVRHP
jgi:hypothetical protein